MALGLLVRDLGHVGGLLRIAAQIGGPGQTQGLHQVADNWDAGGAYM
ncbi:hypothetical protein [Streptomyces beigongshangae]|nr:hypothetical protein [Streptomyces sp. REN17]